MISYWGVDHGDEVSKGAEEKWKMGRGSLERQGFHAKNKAPAGRMAAAANRGFRQENAHSKRRIATGAATGAGLGLLAAGPVGALPGAVYGAGAGTAYSLYRGMKGQNQAFRNQLGNELKRGTVKYRKNS